MFLGHFAVGFAAKRVAPRTSLGLLVGASLLLDLIWPLLLLAGVERARVDPGNTVVTPLAFEHYPLTHSLAAVVGWSALAAALVWARSRRAAVVVGLLVASHWVLDWVTHRPDLPLFPGGPEVGLGLWGSLPGTLLVEGALFGFGVLAYTSASTPRDGVGRWGWGGLVAFLALIYGANVFGPPPPSIGAVAWAGLALWLLPPWCAWVDRHRRGR